MRWVLAMSAAIGIACYAPIVPEGTVCDSSEHCPTGLTCIDGRCTRGDAPGDDASTSDAPRDGAVDGPTDGAMIDAPPQGCSPSGFNCTGGYNLTSCNGLCFIRCANAVTRSEAQTRCAAWGGSLAALDMMAANECANQSEVPLSWIGLQQGAGGISTAAGWTWAGSTAVTFTAWSTGQPDDADAVENNQQNCGAAFSGVWDDVDCATSLGFICRR